MEKSLTKTLVFQLQSDNERLLSEAYHEARCVYNQTIHLAKDGMDWDDISPRLEDEASLVKNTTQRIVAKTLEALQQSYDRDDYNTPSHEKTGPYPLRMNSHSVLNALTKRSGTGYIGLLIASPDPPMSTRATLSCAHQNAERSENSEAVAGRYC